MMHHGLSITFLKTLTPPALLPNYKNKKSRLKTLFEDTLQEPIPDRLSPHELAKTIEAEAKRSSSHPLFNRSRWQSIAAILLFFFLEMSLVGSGITLLLLLTSLHKNARWYAKH